MSDEIKNSNEPEENPSNKNKDDNTAAGKRVFILTSEMVKQLGLDEKIKIFKDKIKIDNSIKPVSAVQVDKDKKELIIRDSKNIEVDSNLKSNLSTANGEASNDTKEVAEEKSETLSLNSENEKQTEAENKSVSKKSVPIIVHHVETLAKPLILRRSPTKNGIVVIKSPVVGNDKSISRPNKLKIIGDFKAVAVKPSAVRKPTKLVPKKLIKHPNVGTAAANRVKVNAGAAKQSDNSEDVIFIDAVQNTSPGSNKEKSQRGFKRPVLTYSRNSAANRRKQQLNVNSKQTLPSKVIKLSTINSNASRDDVLNSQDLCQPPTEELNKILQTVEVEIEEVTGNKSTTDKELDSAKSKKKEKKPKKKKNQKVIDLRDDADLLMPKKRGRPRKYFLKTIPTPMLLPIKSEFDDEPEINYLNRKSNNSNLNNELESSTFNEEAETSHVNQNSEIQNSNKELEGSNLNAEETSHLNEELEVCNLNKNLNRELENSNFNEEIESCHLNKEFEVCNLNQNSEIQTLNKEFENSNLNEEVESCQFNEESEVCNLNKNSEIQNLNKKLSSSNLDEEVEISNFNKESAFNDSKVAASVENFESIYIKDCKKTEENDEETTNYNNKEVETPVDVPVRRRRGRPRKSTTSSPSLSKKKTVSNDDDDLNKKKTVLNDDDDLNKKKTVSNDDDDSNKKKTVSNDDDSNKNNTVSNDEHDEDNNNNDDDDEDDDYEENYNSVKPRKRKSKKGKKTGWYIEPDNDNEGTKAGKKGKVNKDEEIQCGKCDQKMLRSKWSAHNLSKHNNTGWLQGSRDPNYENNEKLWKSVLTIAIKKKKGSLICEKCETTKRSVIGFISHYKFCGKSQEERDAMMWVCPLCKGIFMPSSQDFHERVHREEQRQASMVIDVPDDDDGKKRRRAAEKATTKILEFTKIVKDEPPPSKKSKKVKLKVKDFIVKPPTSKRVPNVWKGAWAKDIAANRQAKCRNVGCEFATNDINEICKHYSLCNFVPQTEFVCKICKFFSKFQEDVANHVRSEHSDKINSGEDSDFNINELSDGSNDSDNNEEVGAGEEGDNNKRSNKNKRKFKQFDKQITSSTRVKFLRKNECYPLSNPSITYIPSLKWTMTFELRNYELKLFENLLPNSFNLFKNSQAQDYLPELKVSMRTKQMKNVSQDFEFVRIKIIKEENLTEEEKRDKGWKCWKQFESSIVNNVPMFFVGGPVWSMAWLPIPAPMYCHQADQYLAVSTHPTMESKYKINNSYKFKNIIQIWNLGHLDHILSVPPIPKLSYVIAHNNGTIWCMEWCPSGTYHHDVLKNDIFEGSLKRMGILATASSDGRVHIYSLPFPEELKFEKTDENDLPVYQTDPVIILYVNKIIAEDNKADWQCTSLSWNKLHGHDTVAAGFSNGYVAIWHLMSKSPLLVMKNENTININAFQHFYAHGHAVTYVGIVPVSGKNYLATSSLDRCTKVWDLEDPYCPIDTVKKGAGTNGAWMTHWPNIYTSYDDALGLGHTVSYLMGVRDPPSSIFPLLPSNSTTYGLAVSDYANGICHGTLAGDIAAIFPFQMMYIKEIDKLTKKRWLVSSVEVVDFGEPTDTENTSDQNLKDSNEQSNGYKYMPESYDACKDRFGIVFHDDLNNWKSNLVKKSNRRNPVNCETMKSIPIEQYQFTSVNRLAWNQNSWSYLWIAAGYQNGLIRILNLKSMSVDNAVMKHLPGHADSMMHKNDNVEITSVT